MKVALVVPHIFLAKEIFPKVIFSPGHLAISLAEELSRNGVDVTLFSVGKALTKIKNIYTDITFLKNIAEHEEINLLDYFKKHPTKFITYARIAQSEIISKAYVMANSGDFDLVHIYTNEEEIALMFSDLCIKPVIFTHHEPFNFLSKYQSFFPKFKDKNWIAISNAQRNSMPKDTNFLKTIYHGIDLQNRKPILNPKKDYFAYFGRIIEQKGVHLAIQACKESGEKLKIAGKYYTNDSYWNKKIEPEVDENIEYLGFLSKEKEKIDFLGNAKALIVPSIWDEPFGMVIIEALSLGTPVMGIDNGAISEIITKDVGFLIDKNNIVEEIKNAMTKVSSIRSDSCINHIKNNFSLNKMAMDHLEVYRALI